MSNESEKTIQLKRALQAIKDLRTRLESVEQARREPIAVIGMACRFPGGGDTPAAFWSALMEKVDGIREVPTDRWDSDDLYHSDPDQAGKVTTRWGGFLAQVDQFDAPFFGISPREAAGMDPQQRLLLEVTAEAFENAGLAADRLAGSRTGVFMGLHSLSNDYYLMQASDPENLDLYSGTGTSQAVASGRISYLYDLQGPCITMDTACSASLVAMHVAVQSLRNGECNLALAGGANVMVTPHFTVVSSRMRMMAADGRCKTFDARANGFVRGEGAGVVVLKRLSDALRDGDPVLALIRGSAVNQDGHSNGLTAPNGLSQQAVIRQALENAGVKPEQITYVETHGTGTALGDPIEVEALGAVYGAPRPDGLPCVLGAVKTNLGHLEGGAGIAGLIKTVLALQHRQIPANLHFQQLNPHISLAGTRLELAIEEREWQAGEGRRLAGVSSFGWSGTNAHVILEEYTRASEPIVRPAHAQQNLPHLLAFSARSPEALKALAERYLERLNSNDAALADLCATAATRRSPYEQRVAVVGHTKAELAEALAAFVQSEKHARLATGQVSETGQPGVVFVYSGQGGQWVSMGRQLLQTDPVFRQAIEQCEQALQPYLDWSLREQLLAGPQSSRLDETDVLQPVLVALQIALTASLRARGVEPAAVVGHSVGEISAAYAAGAISLEEAARIVCTRSRLMRRTSGQGAVAAVGLSFEETGEWIKSYGERLAVAVSNSPSSSVISGDPDAVNEVLARLREQNIFCRPVNMQVAVHSPQMDPLRGVLVAELQSLRPHASAIPLISTVSGERIEGTALDADYWGRNLRQPVLFAKAVERLSADGYRVFVEVGPHPVLLAPIGQTAQGGEPSLLATMRREEDEQSGLQRLMAGLYCAGIHLDWSQVLAEPGRFVPLPNYPWQRKRYWLQIGHPPVDPLANWFYQVKWTPGDLQPAASTEPGNWLVFCAPGEPGEALSGRLKELGGRVLRVWPGDDFCQLAENHYQVNPRSRADFIRLIDAAGEQGLNPRGIAYLWGLNAPSEVQLDANALEQAQALHLAGALHLTQALAAQNWPEGSSPRVWWITHEAQAVTGSAAGLAQAPLWGFGRVLAFEHPELWGGLIDIDDTAAERLARALLGPADQQIAFRQGRRYQAHLVHQPNPAGSVPEPQFRRDASYLITGGLGGLGLQTAGWLAAHGAKHIALMGRSRGSDAARQTARELENSGVQVRLVQGDASRSEDVRRALAEIAQNMPPLRGILHAAGTVEDALLEGQEWPAFERVLAAKVSGAWNLHALSLELDLDCFVLFSSATALLGTPGQSNYAAANAFLDALAAQRRAAGRPALAINWGAWSEVGLAAQPERATWLARMGVEAFSPKKGLAALGRIFQQEGPQVMVAAMNWDQYTTQRPGGSSCDFVAGLARAERAIPATTEGGEPPVSLVEQIAQAQPEARPGLIREQVEQIVAQVLRFDRAALHPDQGFFQMGFDSLLAMELKNRLQKSFGRTLRTTLAFDYPSINLLTRYLMGELFPEQPQPVAAPPAAPADEGLSDLSRDQVKTMLDDELRLLEEDL